jgi:hypothetical protein
MNILSEIRSWFVEDLGWKMFSLLLAVAIWLTAHRILLESTSPASAGGGGTLIYRNLPVTIISAGTDVREYRLLQPTVSVTVTGSTDAIGKLQANQIHATVDLTDTSTVNHDKQRVDVAVPAGITVVSVKPDIIGVIAPPPKD